MKQIDRFRKEFPDGNITFGTPQTDAQIDALEAEIGLSFPEDYRTFLRDHGAVKIDVDTPDFYGDIVVWGIGIEGLDIREGIKNLDEECRSWSCAPLRMLPILGHYAGDVGDTYLLGEDGKLYFHYRGQAQSGRAETLTQGLDDAFEALKESVATMRSDRETEDSVLASVAKAFPHRRDDRAVHLTTAGGHDVEVRMGDGREFHIGLENLPGLFLLWYEPANGRTIGDVFAYNAGAICTRASLIGDKIRFRGRLLLSELDPAAILTVIAHDLGLEPPRGARALDPITHELLVSHVRAVAGGFLKNWAHSFEEDGSARIHYKGTYGDAKLSIRIDGTAMSPAPFPAPRTGKAHTAWLETRISRGEMPREVVIETLNRYNRGFPLVTSDADVNFDMEHFPRTSLDGDDIVIGHRVLANSFSSAVAKAHGLDPFVDEIVGAKKDLMRELEIEEALPFDEYEALIGIPFGPLGKALARRYARSKVSYQSAFGEVGKVVRWVAEYGTARKKAFATPWGRARPFLDASYKEGFRTESCVVALLEGGATTDECTCIAYFEAGDRQGQAAVVARDLRGLLSLFALGTPGIDVVDEESAKHARRRSFAMYHEQAELIRWLEGLGILPAEDPLAVVTASGLPRHGAVDLSKNLAQEAS